MVTFSTNDAAVLAETSYDSRRFIKPKLLKSCPHRHVQAHLLADHTLVLPGSNSLHDYLLYNLRPFRVGHRKYKINDKGTAAGDSGTTWHQGFLAYSRIIHDWLAEEGIRPKFIIGHSLGAAATQVLCRGYQLPGIAFAAPRPLAGKNEVAAQKGCLIINRFDDGVPKLPTAFKHMGVVKLLKIKSNRRLTAHSMKHYRHIVKEAVAHKVIPPTWSGK